MWLLSAARFGLRKGYLARAGKVFNAALFETVQQVQENFSSRQGIAAGAVPINHRDTEMIGNSFEPIIYQAGNSIAGKRYRADRKSVV